MTRFWRLMIVVPVTLSSCSKIEEPVFRAVENFRVVSVGLEEVTIDCGIRYYNPNNFTVTVKETEADVAVDDIEIGNFMQKDPVEVKSKADFTVVLGGSIPLTRFLEMNVADLQKREVVLRAEGTTRVGKAGVFIGRKITYQGRHRLDQIRL